MYSLTLLHQFHYRNLPSNQQLRGGHGPQLQTAALDPHHQLTPGDVDLLRAVGQDTPVLLHLQFLRANELDPGQSRQHISRHVKGSGRPDQQPTLVSHANHLWKIYENSRHSLPVPHGLFPLFVIK